ncbi:transmembrane reductase CYB561D2-like isoform X1 [Zophobas morio]|uniref:transmembrane reductase CYB561D2-like isoform X1 n=1 Tax=Zophobas morio TaxID=2755281 RepID=UPI00308342D3
MYDLGSVTKNVSRFLLNWLTRNLLAGVVVYSCFLPIKYYNYWFSWHVILCTLGMIPLMTEALMLFPSDELWTTQTTRRQRYWIHGCLFLLGTILVSAGNIDTFYFLEDGYHLYTIHGITGLISMILFILSIFLGLMATYSQYLKHYLRPVWFKLAHNFVGLLGYVVGVVSLCYAYYTDWFVFYTSKESRLIALIATILGTLWTINGSLMSAYSQIRALLNY